MPDDRRPLVRAPLILPSPLQRYRPHPGRHALYDGFALTTLGDGDSDGNFVLVFGSVPPERVFARASAFFDGAGYSVTVEVGAAQPMEDAVQSRGWLLDEEEPALVLSTLPAILPPPPLDLVIHEATTEAQFADFFALTHTATPWVPSLDAATDPAVCVLVGYRNGAAVATSRITCFGAVGEISGVGTVPEQRRQGFGTAMTWAAIAAGIRRGCEAISLTASPMGEPVYVKMGFAPVCTYRTYLAPDG